MDNDVPQLWHACVMRSFSRASASLVLRYMKRKHKLLITRVTASTALLPSRFPMNGAVDGDRPSTKRSCYMLWAPRVELQKAFHLLFRDLLTSRENRVRCWHRRERACGARNERTRDGSPAAGDQLSDSENDL